MIPNPVTTTRRRLKWTPAWQRSGFLRVSGDVRNRLLDRGDFLGLFIGISVSNSSSRAITSSTVSSESAPRSSTKEELVLDLRFVHAELFRDDLLTRCSTFSNGGLLPLCSLLSKFEGAHCSRIALAFFKPYTMPPLTWSVAPVNVGGARRGEEGTTAATVFRTPEPASGNLLEQRRPLLFRERPGSCRCR